jgi:catechol 2,3-dioxygenase-like lactoylglutathione lyase family enzyme
VAVNRGIDHVVLCVFDLDAARRFYERLGFTVTPRALHPFGTGNHVVQLDGNYIELLSVVEPAKIAAAQPGEFSFGDHNARYLKSGEGMSMLALSSDDARHDHEEFVESGLDTYRVLDFSRQAMLPDGRQVTVAFSLVFVTDTRLPGLALFVCQHHAPRHFWKPEYQRHANGARVVAEAVMVADRPVSLRDVLERLAGVASVSTTGTSLAVKTPRGDISVLDRGAFARRFPGAPTPVAGSPPRFAAYRVAVVDLDSVAALLSNNAVTFAKADGRLCVAGAFGMIVEFSQDWE